MKAVIIATLLGIYALGIWIAVGMVIMRRWFEDGEDDELPEAETMKAWDV